MKELFPQEDFKITELPNPVVLRGDVSEEALSHIVHVAEDYSLSVISHLKPLLGVGRATQNDIGGKLSKLQGDVRALHREVKKLIETIKTE